MSCFLPNDILKNVVRNADGELREWALEALEGGERLRGVRDAAVLRVARRATAAAKRTIYDGGGRRQLPGALLRRDGAAACGDASADDCYEQLGAVVLLLRDAFGRKSVDVDGMALDATVHYGRRYSNAFWNGEQMVVGDGDGKLFARFVLVDVIGHELGHAVVQYEAALETSGESGALNEHFADVFGILAKQHFLGLDAAASDWLIGAGIFTPKVHGRALRSMLDPGSAYDDHILGRDDQPRVMSDYARSADDDGGVHRNCSIPNRAFAECARIIGGPAWKSAGRIWYATLCERLRRDATFQDCADQTLAMAGELFGRDSRERRAVRGGWKRVEITPVARLSRGARINIATRRGDRDVSIGEEAAVRAETRSPRNLEEV